MKKKSRRHVQLVKFAKATLAIMQSDEEWSSSTLGDISSAAFDFGLAETDDDGMFKIIKDRRRKK